MPWAGCASLPAASCFSCDKISAWSSARKESLNLPKDFAAAKPRSRQRPGPPELRVVDAPAMNPSTVFVFAMSWTRCASKSFGLIKFSALERLIAIWWTNSSTPSDVEAMEERAGETDGV